MHRLVCCLIGFRKPFTTEDVTDVLPVYVDVDEKAAVDVSPVRHHMNRAAVKQLLKPLFGCWPLELRQFRRVDVSQSDPFTSHAKGVAVEDSYIQRAQQRERVVRSSVSRGRSCLLVSRLEFISSFRVALWATPCGTSWAMLSIGRQTIRVFLRRRRIPAELTVRLEG